MASTATRVLRDCLVYVNDQMAAVTNAKRLVVHYEDLVDEPDGLAKRLAARRQRETVEVLL